MRPGFLVIDKAPGLTSHDIVAMVRAVLGIKKVGHTGTLDPFATGVLPLALGPATRFIQYLDESVKVYDATIQFGTATDTGDLTGTVVEERPVPVLEDGHIASVLETFQGVRMQTPPAYSAVKVKGKPLYAYAREGKAVTAKARPIRIDSITQLERGEDWLRVLIRCGRGTYARVLADEIAVALGTAGHLRALRRRQSGPFGLEAALPLEALSEIVAGRADWQATLRRKKGQERVPWAPRDQVRDALAARLVTPFSALEHLPVCEVPEPLRARVLNGGGVPAPPQGLAEGERYRVVAGSQLLAVAERTSEGGKALRVLAH